MTAPAAWAGVVTVTEVALLTVRLVPGVPPKVTPVAPVRLVPDSITEVPPAVLPLAGKALLRVGVALEVTVRVYWALAAWLKASFIETMNV
ncbi:hypothetical protein D3C77_570640 [compost metagenome]